ncbi:MAG: hypothetical protein QNJ98_07990 [Planctomycetota bacterium]|nr:hypothetical protein [Planctomycetota bacterium]
MSRTLVPVLVVLALGGIALWLLSTPAPDGLEIVSEGERGNPVSPADAARAGTSEPGPVRVDDVGDGVQGPGTESEHVVVRVLGPGDQPVREGSFRLLSWHPGYVPGDRRPDRARNGRASGGFVDGQFRIHRSALVGPVELTVAAADPDLLERQYRELDPAAMPRVVRLVRGRRIDGHVLTAEGGGYVKAHVRAWVDTPSAEPGPMRIRSVQTDAQGAFRLLVPPDRPVMVEAQGRRLDWASASRRVDATTDTVELRLPSEVSMDVHVERPDGTPAAHAKVRLRLEAAEARDRASPSVRFPGVGLRETRVNEQGWARIARLPPDQPVLVSVEAPTYALPFAAPEPLRVVPSVGRAVVRLAEGVAITGRIEGPEPDSMRSVSIAAFDAVSNQRIPGKVRPDGRFLIEALRPGRYRIHASSLPGHGERVIEDAAAPSSGWRITLPRVHTLSVPLEGRPDHGFHAQWVGPSHRAAAPVTRSRIVIQGLPDEPGTLYLGASGDPRYGMRHVRSPLEEQRPLKLVEGRIIRGRVEGGGTKETTSRRGLPRPGRILVIGRDLEVVTSNRLGDFFATPGLPEGSYRLELRDPETDRLVDSVVGVAAGAENVVLRWKGDG